MLSSSRKRTSALKASSILFELVRESFESLGVLRMGDRAFRVEFEVKDRSNRECRHDHCREVVQSSIWTTEVREDRGESSKIHRFEVLPRCHFEGIRSRGLWHGVRRRIR